MDVFMEGISGGQNNINGGPEEKSLKYDPE